MNVSLRLPPLVVSALLFLLCLPSAFPQGSRQISEQEPVQEKDRDNPQARDAWFMRGRKGLPGESPATLRYRAYQQKLQLRQWRSASFGFTPQVSTSNTWTPLGPAPMISAAYAGSPQDYNYVSGRATAVAIDPADSTGNTVYIGGAHGGVWKSSNAASPSPSSVTWTPVADYAATLSIGSIAIQPGNANPSNSVVLVGTGEPNNSADSYYGLGILRSANGGATWTLITGDNAGHSFAGLGFSKIAFSTSNPNLVVAAAATAYTGESEGLAIENNRGIYVSANAGQTWSSASILDGSTQISPASVTSVIYHPAAGKFFAAIRFHGIYSSSDGANWTRLPDAYQPGSNLTSSLCPPSGAATCLLYRGELSVPVVSASVAARNELYVWVVDVDTTTYPATLSDGGIWLNTTGGVSPWASISDSGIAACGDIGGGCGVEQGTYNLELLSIVNGTGTDLYAGAINLYKCTVPSPTSNSPACAAPFINLTHVYGCSSIAKVHPDQHHLAAMIANSKALIYFANDGGVYRALDGYTGLLTGTCGSSNSFDSLNQTLGSLTQFVSISTHPNDATVVFGGTQDNGSPVTHAGLPSLEWQNIHAGDGGYNAVNPVSPSDWFASYPDTGDQTLEVDHCPNGTTCDATQFSAVISSSELGGDDGAFYFPYILDPQAPKELLLGTCRLWRIDNATNPTGFNAISSDFEPGGMTPCTGGEVNTARAIAAGGPTDSNGYSKVIYVGTDGYGPMLGASPAGGRVFITNDASVASPLFTEVTGSINPGSYPVSDIEVDPSDSTGQTAYAAIMGFHVSHVFKTTNAGASWIDFSGSPPNSLPDSPVNSLVLDSQAGMIYAGTDVGVFASPTATASWSELGPVESASNVGYLPNVPVTALRLFHANGQKLLRAATYGRGVWQYALVSAPDYSIAISNTPLTVYGSQTSSFAGTLISLGGYNSAVNLSCASGSTSPPNTCSVSSNPVTPTGSGAAFSVGAGGVIGDYSFNVHGAGTDSSNITHDAAVVLHVVDFAIGTPSPSSLTIAQGGFGTATFTLSASGSFSGTVNLTCTGLPAGLSCAFSPSSAQPTSGAPVTVTLSVNAGSNAAAGTSTIGVAATVTGAPAAKTQSMTISLTTAPFTVSNTSTPQTVKAGQAATYSLTIAPQQGSALANNVQLSCASTDLAAAIAQCSFSPSQIAAGTTAPQTITLTITTAGPAAQGRENRSPSNPSTNSGNKSADLFMISLAGLWLGVWGWRRPSAKTQQQLLTLLICFLTTILVSCGGGAGSGGSSSSESLVSVTVSPSTASVYPTQTQQFIAQVIGSTNTAVNWSASKGTIDANGLYTPPSTVAANSQATVTATSQADSNASGQAAVTILAIAVQITPASTTLYPTQEQQFNATISGSTNSAVTWSIVSGPGTILASGLYTAPASMTSPQQTTVKATSQADPTKSQTASVALAPQTPSGSYTIHINATAGNLVETTTAGLTVQ